MEHSIGSFVLRTIGHQEVELSDGMTGRVTFNGGGVKTGQVEMREGKPFLDTPSSLVALTYRNVRYFEIKK